MERLRGHLMRRRSNIVWIAFIAAGLPLSAVTVSALLRLHCPQNGGQGLLQIFYRVTKINAPRADWPQLFSRCENFEFLRLVLKTKVSEDVASKLTMRRGQKGFISLTRIDSWHFLINNVKWGLGGGEGGTCDH